MNWITAILLFTAFFVLEFIAVKGLHGVMENKVLLSGFCCAAEWIIYLFGIYEFFGFSILYNTDNCRGYYRNNDSSLS